MALSQSTNISKFWPRPGTLAAKMKQLKGEIIKKRSKKMTELFREVSYENNKRWLKWQGEVLIDEYGKPGSFIGRNMSYKPIVIKSNLPAKISFATTSGINSTIIIDSPDANMLIGKGDMLLQKDSVLTRIQGAFIEDKDLMKIVGG